MTTKKSIKKAKELSYLMIDQLKNELANAYALLVGIAGISYVSLSNVSNFDISPYLRMSIIIFLFSSILFFAYFITRLNLKLFEHYALLKDIIKND